MTDTQPAAQCSNGCEAAVDEMSRLGQEIGTTARDEAFIWMTSDAANKADSAIDILDRLESEAAKTARDQLYARARESVERVQSRHDALALLYNAALKDNANLELRLLDGGLDTDYYKAWAEGSGRQLTETQQELARVKSTLEVVDGNRAELFETVRAIRGEVARFERAGYFNPEATRRLLKRVNEALNPGGDVGQG